MIRVFTFLIGILPTLIWAQPWTAQVTITTDGGATSYQHSGDKINWDAVDHAISMSGDISVRYGSGGSETCEGAARILMTQGFGIEGVFTVSAEALFDPSGSGWQVPIRRNQTVKFTAFDGHNRLGDYVDDDGQITINEFICHGDSVEMSVTYAGMTELVEGTGPNVVGVNVTTRMTAPVIPY